MAEAATQALNLLYCYASEDQPWLENIDAQLRELKRHCQIISRFDGELVSNPTHKAHLLALFDKIDLVLLLVSPHFHPVEAFWAEISHESWHVRWLGGCRVVALMLEPVAWTHAPAESREILPREGVPPRAEQEREPVAPLEVFPSDVRPLAAWPSQEQAFEQIEQWMRVTIEKQWLARGEYLSLEGMGVMDEEALAAYEEALRLNPALKEAWYGKAHVLISLRQHEEMIEKAIRWKPTVKRAWQDQARLFVGPKRYEEALLASDEALKLDPVYPWAWYTKAAAFAGLKRYEEALHAYDEALRGNPTRGSFWHQKSEILKALGRKREARQAQKTARQLGWLL